MPPKTQRKSALPSTLLVLLLGALLIAIPMVSYAWGPSEPTSDPIGVCQGEFPGLTRRIVECIQNTILAAVHTILVDLFQYFYAALGACMTLAVAIWGFQMATGQRAWPAKRGFVLAVKIAVLVSLFGASGLNFTYFFEAALDFLGVILGAVTGYVDFSPALDCGVSDTPTDPSLVVWDRVDCAINTLVGGVFSGSDVSLGIGGFLLAAILSGGPGFFVGLLGFLVVVQVLFAIIRALYIYILSYVAFSLMALVAPLFLPMILFRATQGYFEKWLKLTLGFILQPIFLFVYLGMLLLAFDTVVYTGPGSLFNVITGGEYTSCAAPSCPTTGCTITSCQPIGTWLVNAESPAPPSAPPGAPPRSVYIEQEHGTMSVNTNVEHTKKSQTTCTTPTTCTTTAVGNITEAESGMLNNLPEVETTTGDWTGAATNSIQEKVYSALNINDYFFHVNVPITVVDWDALSQVPPVSGTSTADVQRYLINLFTALFMSVATTGVFLLLLDKLPFIGSGIANIGSFVSGAGGLSGFGFGGLAPPGAGMVDNLKKKIVGS